MEPDLELGKAVSRLMPKHKDHPVNVASNSHVSYSVVRAGERNEGSFESTTAHNDSQFCHCRHQHRSNAKQETSLIGVYPCELDWLSGCIEHRRCELEAQHKQTCDFMYLTQTPRRSR